MMMKLTGRLLAAALLSVTAAGCQGEEPAAAEGDSLATQEAKAGLTCIQGFEGIKNCATGRAKLTNTGKSIAVSSLTSVKTDGFSSEFPRATDWVLKTELGGVGALGQGFTLAARDGDQVVSAISVQPGKERDQVTMTPSFTGRAGGSPFTVNLWRGNSLMHSHYFEQDYGVGSQWYQIHIGLTRLDFGFKNHSSTSMFDRIGAGACIWSFRGTGDAFTLDVNGKPVSGDFLEIVEEIGDGHYPYTGFSSIDVKAAASTFNILGESTVAAK
ncbi:hypothetical protein [Corallococcus carmarthensis]|uniref:Lipoprotein n=1 Tax=Corallococcus carmarthensis TaxID=2316728 RepID=A0A3A8KHG6_9BACT|nr:hypothetical protein [Corallococcus carmarthensis]NOK16281.1 hypothetical protein [Corallococcus carmarthensis]RKH06539.1 hypothetical protein D7X32_04995 [Corallococcus carmarthensis]